MVDIFAITNRGLENVSATEMGRIPGLQVEAVSYRRIRANFSGDPAELLELRTVDDVFIDLGCWDEIPPQRNALGLIRERSRTLDFDPALDAISRVRPLLARPLFSVTANFVGKRNYSTDEIKNAVAEGIASRYAWPYNSDEAGDFNIRIFIEHERAYLGARLGDHPLHRRAYKQAHVSGSLKPSVAAAMLQIGGVMPGASVLDPFCGAGTILIEAALIGATSLGGDRQPEVLRAAKTNAGFAGMRIDVNLWDARRLPFADHSIEQAVTNLPWGRQVNVDESLASFYRSICAELSRVVQRDGQMVLLINLPQLVHFDKLVRQVEIEISLFGQTPSILVFAPAVKNDPRIFANLR